MSWAVDPPVRTSVFDEYVSDRISKLSPTGFRDIEFGPILSPNLIASELAANLCVDWSRLSGGSDGYVELRSGAATIRMPRECSFGSNFNPNPRIPDQNPGPVVAGQGGMPLFLDYESTSGGLVLNSPDAALTAFELVSRAELFTGPIPTLLSGLFEQQHPGKLFHFAIDGFNSLDAGNVVAPGTSAKTLASDLCYSGSVLSGGIPGDLFVRSSGQLHQVSCMNGTENPTPTLGLQSSGQPLFLDFDPATGALVVDSPNASITAFEMTSSSESFTGVKASTLDGLFDIFNTGKIFRLNPDGFKTLDLGSPVRSGTTAATLAADICYRGAALKGGPLGEMFVRSGDAVHAVSCGAPDDSVDLAAAMDPDADIGVFVDPDGGNLVVHVPGEPDGAFRPLTRFEITASSDVFSPGNKLSGALDWKSDTLTASHLLKVDGNGFGSVDFGPILRDGVSLTDLESVFSVSATFDGGEVASAVQFVNLAIVPEPSNGLLMMLPAILLLVCRRR